MDFWVCRECGIKNQNNDQFCSNCGNKHIKAAEGNGIDRQITGNYQENESSQVEIPTKRKEPSTTPRKHWLSRLVGILVAYVLLVGGFWGLGYITCQYDIASFGLAFLPIPGYSRDVLLHNLYVHCYDMEVQVNFIADGVVQHTKTARVKDGSSVSPYTFSMSDYELANPGEVVIRKDEYGEPFPAVVNFYLIPSTKSTAEFVAGSTFPQDEPIIDTIESIVYSNPWTLERIKSEFSKHFDIASLDKHREHTFSIDNAQLFFYDADWYYSYGVKYQGDNSDVLFTLEYTTVYDPADCNTNLPTYWNWFTAECTFSDVVSNSGNEFYFYSDSSHQIYTNKEYYDSKTVSQYIIWNTSCLYK